MSGEKPKPVEIIVGRDAWKFSQERLVEVLLGLDPGERYDWRCQAVIIANYMPPHPDERTSPRCVVKLGDSFLRHSKGPRQGHSWDVYGDDYLYPELALLALSQADPPPWAVRTEKRADGKAEANQEATTKGKAMSDEKSVEEQLRLAGCDIAHALAAVETLRRINRDDSAVHMLRTWYLRDVALGNSHCYPPPGGTERNKA